MVSKKENPFKKLILSNQFLVVNILTYNRQHRAFEMIEEYYEQKSSKEILAEVSLMIESYIPVKVQKDGIDNFDKAFARSLKFESINGPKVLRSCIDLIEDTESAIVEFFKNGLCLQSEVNSSYGEMYLRLYGLLNTVSLQIEAIIELIELFKISGKKKLVNDLKKTQICVLRNKLGSHTVKYKTSEIQSFETFRLTRISLTKWGRDIHFSGIEAPTERVNLLGVLEDYNKISEDILFDICNKAVQSLFKGDGEDKRNIQDVLDYVNTRICDYKQIALR